MKGLRVLLAFALLLLGAAQLHTQEGPATLRVHFVDVGQGDGVLIQSPSGQNVVYDAGENPRRMRDYPPFFTAGSASDFSCKAGYPHGARIRSFR